MQATIERPWNKQSGRVDVIEITPEQLEASRRKFAQDIARDPNHERRWNSTTGQYEWYFVTPEMREADRRREAFVAEFGIYA